MAAVLIPVLLRQEERGNRRETAKYPNSYFLAAAAPPPQKKNTHTRTHARTRATHFMFGVFMVADDGQNRVLYKEAQCGHAGQRRKG